MTENNRQRQQEEPEELKELVIPRYIKRLALLVLLTAILSNSLLIKLSNPLIVPWVMEKKYHEKFVYLGQNAMYGGADAVVSPAANPDQWVKVSAEGLFPFNFHYVDDYYAVTLEALLQKRLNVLAARCTAADKVVIRAEVSRYPMPEYEKKYKLNELDEKMDTEPDLLNPRNVHMEIYGFFFGNPAKKEEMTQEVYEIYKKYSGVSDYMAFVIDISEYPEYEGLEDIHGEKVMMNFWDKANPLGSKGTLWRVSTVEYDEAIALNDYEYFKNTFEDMLKKVQETDQRETELRNQQNTEVYDEY